LGVRVRLPRQVLLVDGLCKLDSVGLWHVMQSSHSASLRELRWLFLAPGLGEVEGVWPLG
jgi:hypothetical protein